ncbi:MAG: carboxypeptidase-like regulatory domain-containing protein [Acidobacteriaceae bacterium]
MERGSLRSLAAAFTVVLALWSAAASLDGQQNLAGGPGYPVRGVVVNSVTGQPVSGALVELNQDFAMLTDGSGQFSFDNVPQRTYMVAVSKPGYRGFGHPRQGIRFVSLGSVLAQLAPDRRIDVGPDMPSLSFRIMPEVSITGQVTLSTADPADGIRVRAYGLRIQNGRPVWDLAGTATTRSDGSFRLADLAPGKYMLSTEATLDNPDSPERSRLPVWGFPPAYYPDSEDPNSAGNLNLAPGQQAEADFTLTRQQFFPVTVAVRSAESAAAAFEVLDSSGHPTGFSVHYDSREQVVHAVAPNGSWILEGRSYGHALGWGRTNFVVASAPASLAIDVQSIPHIPVFIRRDFAASDHPTGGDDPGVNLTLAPVDQFLLNGRGGYLARDPGSDGGWQLNLTQPGRYWTEVTPYSAAYVSSITSGGVDLASDPLAIEPGSSVAPIEITLRDDGGTITGQLSASASGGPGTATAPGDNSLHFVYAIPLFPSASQLPQATTQSDRTFSIGNLAPGSYRVVACDAPQEIDFHSPDGLSAWTGQGQTVTVAAGSAASVTLAVSSCGVAP